MKIKYAALNFGYAESYFLGGIVCQISHYNMGRIVSFSSTKEALDSLAHDFLLIYKRNNNLPDENKEPDPCCLKNMKKKYCSECGTLISSLSSIPKVNAADFEAAVKDFLSWDVDELSQIVEDGELVWEFGVPVSSLIGQKKDSILVIDSYAEKRFSEALKLKG